jgi:hypothetical protein
MFFWALNFFLMKNGLKLAQGVFIAWLVAWLISFIAWLVPGPHPTCGPTQEDDIAGIVRYHTYEVLQQELNNPRVRWAYLPRHSGGVNWYKNMWSGVHWKNTSLSVTFKILWTGVNRGSHSLKTCACPIPCTWPGPGRPSSTWSSGRHRPPKANVL